MNTGVMFQHSQSEKLVAERTTLLKIHWQINQWATLLGWERSCYARENTEQGKRKTSKIWMSSLHADHTEWASQQCTGVGTEGLVQFHSHQGPEATKCCPLGRTTAVEALGDGEVGKGLGRGLWRWAGEEQGSAHPHACTWERMACHCRSAHVMVFGLYLQRPARKHVNIGWMDFHAVRLKSYRKWCVKLPLTAPDIKGDLGQKRKAQMGKYVIKNIQQNARCSIQQIKISQSWH